MKNQSTGNIQEEKIDEAKKQEELREALYLMYDIQERLGFSFITLNDTAYSIRNQIELGNRLTGDRISVGLKKNEATYQRVRDLKDILETNKIKVSKGLRGFNFTFLNTPVEIILFTKKYPFFENPELRFFNVYEFYVPNPFEDYWKVRKLIK